MLDRRECFIGVSAISTEGLLRDWRWLLGDRPYELLRGTAFGDLFLRDGTGRVLFLDTMQGALKPFARSERDLGVVLRDRLVRREVLLPRVVEELRKAGKRLQPGQCYSPDV